MKHIQYACLNQVLHFQLKDGLPREWAIRQVQEEYEAYRRQLEARSIAYRIVEEATQPDGSIKVRIKRQLNQYDVGNYLNE